MTAQSAIPLKWYVPFATGDSSRVEIPVTSSDATRASQTLGFPPLTMQPPAVGGVPPQGEDFNGAMNQVARVAWWVLNGGGWPFDVTFATNPNINGYPNGAVLQSADFLGQWINTTDNNQINPDTVGTGWVPGFQYGQTALTGLTGGTVTLTPLQAAKRNIVITGTLTSALTLIFPTWIKDWAITNGTTGAFVTIAKTAAGSGITIPQNSAPTLVSGDSTNVVQNPQNIAAATQSTHAMQFGQATGRLVSIQRFNTPGSYTYTPSANVTKIIVEVQGAGGGGGGSQATGASQSSMGLGASAGAYYKVLITAGIAVTGGTIGTGGTAGAVGGSGGGGGTTTFGAIISCPGGNGGTSQAASSILAASTGAAATASATTALPSGSTVMANIAGAAGGFSVFGTGQVGAGSSGGNSPIGNGGSPNAGVAPGTAPPGGSLGAGGSGGCTFSPSSAGQVGGAGANGAVIVWEFT